MSSLRNLLYLLLGAVLAIFINSNLDQRVTIYFTQSARTRELPLAMALFAVLLLGFLAAFLLAVTDQLRLHSRLRQMRLKVERLESELGELRKLPLEESLPAGAGPEVREESEPQPGRL